MHDADSHHNVAVSARLTPSMDHKRRVPLRERLFEAQSQSRSIMEDKSDGYAVRIETLSQDERDTMVLAKLGKKSVLRV